MSSRTTIDPLSITDGKISNQAKISPKKLAPGKTGQVLIAGKDGRFVAGDLPSTTSTTTVVAEEEVLPPNTVKIGPSSYYHGDTNVTKEVGEGPDAIPVRDSSGNLKAETADSATTATTATSATNAANADRLDDQDGSHYLDVENHTGSSATAGDVTTSYKPHKIFEVAATSSNTSNTPTTFTHSFGYIPDVTVYEEVLDENDNVTGYSEIDVDVTNTTSSSSINVSEGGVNLKVVIK